MINLKMSQAVQLEKKIKVKVQWRQRKPLLIGLLIATIVLIILGGLAIYLVVIPAQKVSSSIHNIMATLDQLKTDLDGKDLSKIDTYFTNINGELDSITTEVDKYTFLQDFSLTRGYYNNLQVIRQLSQHSQALLTTTLPQVKVILNSMGYKVDAEGTIPAAGDPTNDNKIQSLISALPQVIKLYDNQEPNILAIVNLFNQLDPTYIPNLGTSNLRDKVVSAQKVTQEYPSLSAQIKELLSVAPQLLGSDTAAKYLVVFQNEKELRSSGGLLSAYGNLTIDKGKLGDNIKATDMWALEGYVSWTLGVDAGHRNIYGQNALMNSGCGSTYLRAQDSGIYPDLNASMNIFKDYYDIAHRYDAKDYPDYQTIIIVNTFFASDIISLVQPIVVQDSDGQTKTITADNAAKEIFAVTSSGPFDPATRKDFIGTVATALKDKFNAMSASDFPRVIETLIRTMQEKNIAFYSKDAVLQNYFDELGISGRIEHNFAGDYLNIGEAQNCSLKSNFYVYDVVTQNINFTPDGHVTKDVNIHWANEKVYDPNESNILSASPLFRYRAWVRVFAPPKTVFTKSDGFASSAYFYQPVTYFDDVMQKQVDDNVIWFDERRLTPQSPIPTHDLNVSYNLPDDIMYTPDKGYRLLIQKHPGKKDEKYVIHINDAGNITSTELNLDRDKVVTYKSGVITVENYDTRLDQYYNLAQQLQTINQ